MANNKPVHQIRLSAIRAAIWLNQSDKTGESWFTVTMSRSYRDKEQLKDTTTFRRDDWSESHWMPHSLGSFGTAKSGERPTPTLNAFDLDDSCNDLLQKVVGGNHERHASR